MKRELNWLLEQPWALMPEVMRSLVQQVRADGASKPPQAARDAARGSGGNGRAGSTAIIPVYGVIVQRASWIDILFGATSTQQISAALADANADSSVSQILLDISSPGGSVYGVQELAYEIANSKKPVIGIANSLAASAAYWLGSQCSEFYCTPGGEVGSIGVYTMHADYSEALKMDGVNVTLISAGDYKTEGNPYEPLGSEARKFTQSRVNDYYNEFTRAVARGRKVSVDKVRGGMGQGRVLGANQARAEGMVDGVMPFSALVSKMVRGPAASRPASALARAQRELAIIGG